LHIEPRFPMCEGCDGLMLSSPSGPAPDEGDGQYRSQQEAGDQVTDF